MKALKIIGPLVVLVGLAACSAPHNSAGAPPLGPVHPVQSARDIALPLQRYELSLDEATAIAKAREELVRACSAAYGVRYTAERGLTLGTLSDRESRRYGLLELADAERFGYHVAEGPATNDKIPDGAEGKPSDEAALREALVLTGHRPDGSPLRPAERPVDPSGSPLPPDGCLGDAQTRLQAGAEAVGPAQLAGLEAQSLQLSEQDSRVLAAWASWASCMRSEGYDYASPWEPNDEATTPTSTPAERQTAVADVGCRSSTGMTSTWMAVDAAYQNRLIEENRVYLDALVRSQAVQLQHARSLVARGEG